MLTAILELNPDELREYLVQQSINHRLEMDNLKKEIKEQALEFGKWATKQKWVWKEYSQVWEIRQYPWSTLSDDDLWNLYLKTQK